MGILALAAGFALFFILLRFLARDREVRRFWLVRVAIAAAVGLVLARLSPLWTRFDDVLDQPAVLLTADVGLAGLVGGLFAFAGAALVSLQQLGRLRKGLNPWPLLASVGAGLALAVGLLTLAPRLTEGPPELHVAVPDLEGRQHTLAEWTGRITVLNFWATWCPPCIAELPDLKTFASGSKTVALVGINAVATEKGGAASVVKFTADHDATWAQLTDPDGLLQKAYAVAGLPTTVVLDREGRVVARREGAVDLAWLSGLEAAYGKP